MYKSRQISKMVLNQNIQYLHTDRLALSFITLNTYNELFSTKL
jgi:hypothetical protein